MSGVKIALGMEIGKCETCAMQSRDARDQVMGHLDNAAQRRLAETAQLRYQNGISLYLEVLDAERNLFAGEQQLRSAKLQNAVSLYIALGSGMYGEAQERQPQSKTSSPK